jgi:hypothetical protein
MPTNTCENCIYFTIEEGTDYGNCKRFPPEIVQDNPTDMNTSNKILKTHWCGEWQGDQQ